ncbi:MAG: prolyl oligopeptidase family serine peptidase [Rhodobacteraceae bacterium]|nr:prolyl oligopeptidase family serine peptidase [Paracoccaceae bacterium]
MMRDLKFGRRPARSGHARQLVVLLHGYGADGADLLGLADPLGPHLPDAVFVAPDAPEPCKGNPFGRQWFPIPWLDGSSEAEAGAGMASARDDLHAFLDARLAEEGLAPGACALVGFSQGTMMSLAVAPERQVALAGVVGFSGRLLDTAAPARAITRPPVLLVHGDADEMVPPACLPEAADALGAAGFETFTHISPGTGHGIAPDGLGVALAFLRRAFGLEAAVRG